MRDNTFGRIPFNTDNRPLPEMPWSPSADPPPIRIPTGKLRPAQKRVPYLRRGAGTAFLQRLRIKRLP